LNFGQYFCDDGNTVNGDGCDSTCDIENGYTCGGGNSTSPDFCWRPNPRLTDAKLSGNNTVITLTFNETTFMQSTFTKDDILVYISGPRDVYSYTIDVLNLNYYRGTSTGFTNLEIQITYKDSGQFFGLNAEGIIFAIRDGSKFLNLRGGSLLESVWVMYGNPREADYACGMDGLWEASFWVVIIFFIINFVGYFIE
jgi:cysteine-rich repeat protein